MGGDVGGALMNWIGAPIKGPKRALLTLLPCEDTRKNMAIYKAESRISPDIEVFSILILNFLMSITVRNIFLLLISYLLYSIFIMADQADKDTLLILTKL